MPIDAVDLLVIDPQNDFMDIGGAALPVAGADADMRRLARWLRAHATQVRSITVTLDSHPSVAIERTSFWRDGEGRAVAPFTVIRAADLESGRFQPRHAAHRPEALAYLQALEAGGRLVLVVWPVHCVLGTWGHNLQGELADAIAEWEAVTGRTCEKLLKGLHPLTEQYSAFRAEVPRADDPRTQLATDAIARLAQRGGPLLVAGEALSHCVAASMDDLLAGMNPARRSQVVLLRDAMSPVTGFETQGQAFLDRAREAGVRIQTLADWA